MWVGYRTAYLRGWCVQHGASPHDKKWARAETTPSKLGVPEGVELSECI